MDKIDALIKNYFEKQSTGVSGHREDALYPDTGVLLAYLDGKLHGEEQERMLVFLRNNADAQELVSRARELVGSERGWEGEKVPADLMEKAKALMRPKSAGACPHCGKAITPFKKPLAVQRWANLAWLLLAAGSFGGSFAFPRYFMQFLVVTVLAGVKGIAEMRATKTQILIYKALSEDPASEQHRLHHHSSRL